MGYLPHPESLHKLAVLMLVTQRRLVEAETLLREELVMRRKLSGNDNVIGERYPIREPGKPRPVPHDTLERGAHDGRLGYSRRAGGLSNGQEILRGCD